MKGQTVLVFNTALKEYYLKHFIADLEVGRHIHVSDYKYYPKYSYNYVSKDNMLYKNINFRNINFKPLLKLLNYVY